VVADRADNVDESASVGVGAAAADAGLRAAASEPGSGLRLSLLGIHDRGEDNDQLCGSHREAARLFGAAQAIRPGVSRLDVAAFMVFSVDPARLVGDVHRELILVEVEVLVGVSVDVL
jgi:hypothetical protein